MTDMRKAALLLVLILLAQPVLEACDMSAFIMRKGLVMADLNQPDGGTHYNGYQTPGDYLAFVMSRSSAAMHDDGYGLIYYPQDTPQIDDRHCFYKRVGVSGQANQVYYTGNLFQPLNEPDIFDLAYDKITGPDARASIVMCHARNATLNPFAPGNHPFRMTLNGQTYALMHNGFIGNTARNFMINETSIMDSDWFQFNGPNYTDFPNWSYPAYWIDSEVLFHYIMCHIVNNDYNVHFGIKTALKKLESYLKLSTNVVNFVFTDGKRLYAFRSTGPEGGNSGYNLGFKVSSSGFSAVRTGFPTANETEISQYELVVLSDDGQVTRYPGILDDPLAFAGETEDAITVPASRPVVAIPDPGQTGIRISFFLEQSARVSINIHNLKGQKVKNLVNTTYAEGKHTVYWDGTDNSGRKTSQGVYFLETISGKQRTVTKVTSYR